jgi:crotonobetainyl-CoA:carnitine CoA-transferase CaiB-like acyl-CoA transferase
VDHLRTEKAEDTTDERAGPGGGELHHADAGERPYDRAYLFNSQNVNKRSLALDMKKPGAKDALARLVAKSDVLTCNFRPGTLERLGFGYAHLAAGRPDIIVLEMPAFGRDGPMASHAALGPTMEMAAGMSSQIAYPGGTPTTTGPSYMDPVGGYHGAAAILTALLHRAATGRGQHIELPQVEAAMHLVGESLIHAAMTGDEAPPDGNQVPWAAPHDAFPAQGADQWIAIAAGSAAEWHALCEAIGAPALKTDPRFATLAARKTNEAALHDVIATWTRARDKHDAAATLQRAGVSAAPVQHARDLAESAYLRERGFFTPLDHPATGRHDYPTVPIRLTRTPGTQHRAAPGFGADNHFVLHDIARLDEAEIAALEASGAISTTPFRQTAIG